MVALERWEVALRGSHQGAATALHRTLMLAYAEPQWLLTNQTPANASVADRNTLHSLQTIAWPDDMPVGLRNQITSLLRAITQAQTWRQQALAQWPREVSAGDLWKKFSSLDKHSEVTNGLSAQTLLNHIDHRALAQGIWQLTAAVEETALRLLKELRKNKAWAGVWRFETPWGEIIIDTTSNNDHYRGQQPLLLIDVGGNDHYAFDEECSPGVTVLLDLAGDDRYIGNGLGRDPSGATLGYAVLLDARGHDHYEGQWLTQGATLFGAAVLIDLEGRDRYQAQGQTQGFALGGIAALLDFDGDDHYHALSQAQAAAGPGALALLYDRAGDDRYVLDNTPLVLPSAQLKNSNASLGQGTAFGMRSRADSTSPTSPGGLALLLDIQGHDSYEAQVFAQGAGYEGGLGVLWDGDGSDLMQASWYALGTAAHHASGVFVAGGAGKDLYTVSHATSLGAAHDGSVSIFVGSFGDDRYNLSTLGIGAAHDGSTALFVERGGNDQYLLKNTLCPGFGASVYSENHSKREENAKTPPINTAFFFDLGGTDHYPSHCADPANGFRWTTGQSLIGLGKGWDNQPQARRYRKFSIPPKARQKQR